MAQTLSEYTPPKVWQWHKQDGGRFTGVNRPTAGALTDKALPVGAHPLQLYSLATPNGQKVTIMLEELLAQGHTGAEYDAWLIDIDKGDQFGAGFVALNPNSKIPALLDRGADQPRQIFESGAILLYLAEKFGAFLASDQAARATALNWLFWQVGSAPYLGGGFGHFYRYAPFPIEYAIDRFALEVKRQLDVLDRHLGENEYMAGAEYSIADIAVWPWHGNVALNRVYDAAEFLEAHEYQNVIRWARQIGARPAVKRGRIVNRVWGEEATQMKERHSAADFEGKTL